MIISDFKQFFTIYLSLFFLTLKNVPPKTAAAEINIIGDNEIERSPVFKGLSSFIEFPEVFPVGEVLPAVVVSGYVVLMETLLSGGGVVVEALEVVCASTGVLSAAVTVVCSVSVSNSMLNSELPELDVLFAGTVVFTAVVTLGIANPNESVAEGTGLGFGSGLAPLTLTGTIKYLEAWERVTETAPSP